MAGHKQSPRQKLINMMYLVLTALLALNVSKEVLDSFITIDEGQLRTRNSIEEELGMRMQVFEDRASDKPLKYAKSYEEASVIRTQADDLVSFINRIKATCIAETEGLTIDEVYNAEVDTVLDVMHVKRKDDYDVTTNVLYGTGDNPATDVRQGDDENFRATALRVQLEDFVVNTSRVIPVSSANSLKQVFDFNQRADAEGDIRDWEYINFHNVPLAAVQSILSKMQMDVRAAELEAMDHLFNDVEGKSMRFTRLREAVIPVTTEVSMGGLFQAEVFLAAYDDTNPPEIRLAAPDARVDDASLEVVGDYEVLAVDSNMMGGVALPANSLGAQHREGVIIFRPSGLPEVRRKFVLDYQVSAPTAIVNPSNMNVFYKGVENPITVGVPGYRAEDITARIDNGTLTRAANGSYIVKVNSGTAANVSLSVALPDGGTRNLPPVVFRLKSVPDPEAYFAGKTAKDNRISKAELRAAQGVRAAVEGFLFPVTYQVLSYDVVIDVNGQPIGHPTNRNALSQNQKILIDEARAGKKVSIENIIVRAPDGTNRKLASINLRIY